MKVHPLAARFGRLPPDEFQALVDDIRANGLRFPISTAIIDGEEQVIDGANRQEACEAAGIEPRYERLNGIDVRAFINSANLARRHWSTGQRAMMIAEMFPESEGPGRGKEDEATKFGESAEIGPRRIYEARLVRRYKPELIDLILFHGLSLSRAYEQAKQAEKEEDEARGEEARRTALARYPDLAKLEEDGELRLPDAEAAAKARDDKAAAEFKERCWTLAKMAGDLVGALGTFGADDIPEFLSAHRQHRDFREPFEQMVPPISNEQIDQMKRGFKTALKLLKEAHHADE